MSMQLRILTFALWLVLLGASGCGNKEATPAGDDEAAAAVTQAAALVIEAAAKSTAAAARSTLVAAEATLAGELPTATPASAPPTATREEATVTPVPAPPTPTVTSIPNMPTPAAAAASSLLGKIVFLSNRDYSGFDPEMPKHLSTHEIYVMNTDGSQQTRLTTDLRICCIDSILVSPDASQILVGSNQQKPLMLLAADGSLLKTVAYPAGGAFAQSWSPDGSKVLVRLAGLREEGKAATEQPEALAVLNMDDNTFDVIFRTNSYLSATYSHDGRQIALSSRDTGGGYRLWLLDADGNNRRPLLSRVAEIMSWSPDGKQIAFEDMPDSLIPDIWVVNVDGTNPRNLTNSPDISEWGPHWSPDSTKLVFQVEGRIGADGQIVMLDLATGAETQLTSEGDNYAPFWVGSATSPTVVTATAPTSTPATAAALSTPAPSATPISPAQPAASASVAHVTADKVNVRAGPGTNYDRKGQVVAGDTLIILERNAAQDWVHVRLPDGSDGWVAVSFTDLGATVQDVPQAANLPPTPAVVAPQPGQIAFKSSRGGIWVMSADGSNQRRLSNQAIYTNALRPDGPEYCARNGLYCVKAYDDGGRGGVDVFVEDREYKTGWHKIVSNSNIDWDPRIHPDGWWVVFVTNRNGNDELWMINRQAQEERRLTFNGWEWDKHPSWSPDGTLITFFSNRVTGRRQIWVLDPNQPLKDGVNPRNLSNNNYDDWEPVWLK
jgi:Tol biopolymer transport system component